MGLDQYAYAKTEASGEEGEIAAFYWRKHSRLQEFMEATYEERTGLSACDLNCGELVLTESDILTLEQMVRTNTLPRSNGGLFYGHQFQDEAAKENQEQDLRFCAWARAEIEAGSTVAYSCWW